jgi:hypothetical protein
MGEGAYHRELEPVVKFIQRGQERTCTLEKEGPVKIELGSSKDPKSRSDSSD